MLLRFGTMGVNMALVTNWEWVDKELVHGLLSEPVAGYRLYFNRPYDGAHDYVFLQGDNARAFELWLYSNSESLTSE